MKSGPSLNGCTSRPRCARARERASVAVVLPAPLWVAAIRIAGGVEVGGAAIGPACQTGRGRTGPGRADRLAPVNTVGGQGKSGAKPARSRHCDRVKEVAGAPSAGHWGGHRFPGKVRPTTPEAR